MAKRVPTGFNHWSLTESYSMMQQCTFNAVDSYCSPLQADNPTAKHKQEESE